MPRTSERLKDLHLRRATAGDKPAKLFDGGGLYLEVQPSGGKWWRWKYRFAGRENRLSLGVYPEVSLREARDERDRLRGILRSGSDPAAGRRATRAARSEATKRAEAEAATFERVGRDWYGRQAEGWAPSHASKVLGRLERDVFPFVGTRPIGSLDAPEILECLRRIESRGAIESARRVRSYIHDIFEHAAVEHLVQRNPTPPVRALRKKPAPRHFPAVTDPKRAGEILRTLRSHRGTFPVSCALRLAPLVFVRPGELRRAEWAGIDLDAAEWRFTLSKTKAEHIVPLSTQAVAILRELHALTGRGRYVFPSERTSQRPMSENAVLYAMRDLGIPADELTGHGFRAMARTMLDEQLGVRVDLIEHQLGHAVRDPLGRAYNRTSFLPERREMMQKWADYLDRLARQTTAANQ